MMDVQTWELWGEDLGRFQHEVEINRKLGEKIEVSYTETFTVPENCDRNAGRTITLAITKMPTETYRRICYTIGI